MTRETSKSIASLAAKGLAGHYLTNKERTAIYASALAQAEIEQESVKAWGVENKKSGKLINCTWETRKEAAWYCTSVVERVIPVLIRRARLRNIFGLASK